MIMQHSPKNMISNQFLDNGNTLVVYTPAISENHSELQYFKNHQFNVHKRSTVLGLITENSICLAVAGTHGKTTTTSMIGSILKDSNLDPTIIVGGVVKSINTNSVLGAGDIFVVEADEFNRSFLELSPTIAVINNIDLEHVDCYKDLEYYKDKENKKVFRLLVCSNCVSCENKKIVFRTRDANSSINIMNLASCWIYKQERPLCFQISSFTSSSKKMKMKK